MSEYEVKCVLDIKAELGESPLWSVEEQALYWLDIEGATMNRFDPKTATNKAWTLPVHPGCFGFRDGGAVIAGQDGFYDFDFATGAVKKVAEAIHDTNKLRFNDGRTDRQGRLVVSTVRADTDVFNTSENGYFRFDGKTVAKVIDAACVTNGTAFSPDGKIMYRSECDKRRILAYDYDAATGTPSRERLFAVVPDELGGLPDGATVDTDGAYWSAIATPTQQNGGIARFTSDGKLDLFIKCPVPVCTMIAFGGSDMSTLYLTTGRLERLLPHKAPPLAGNLFAVATKFRGVPETKFRA
jgi:sugar lactone lactonase YvrE